MWWEKPAKNVISSCEFLGKSLNKLPNKEIAYEVIQGIQPHRLQNVFVCVFTRVFVLVLWSKLWKLKMEFNNDSKLRQCSFGIS